MADSLRELEDQIREWWTLASRPGTKFAGHAPPALPAHITPKDAENFLQGLHRDPPLHVVYGNTFLSQLLSVNQPGTPREGEKRHAFFEMRGAKVWVRDETIVHYATATELIEHYGWSPKQVVSEPNRSGDLTDDGAVDLLVSMKSHQQDAVIAVEAKGTKVQVEELRDGMLGCGGAPEGHHTKTDHQKCRALDVFRPRWFWIVGPVELSGRRGLLFSVRDGRIGAPENNHVVLRAPA